MATPPKKPAPRRKPASTRKPAAARKPNIAPAATGAATSAAAAPAEPKATVAKPAATRAKAPAKTATKAATKTPTKAAAKPAAKPKTLTQPRTAATKTPSRNAAVTTLGKARQAVSDASPAKKWTAAAILGTIGAAVTAALLTLRGSTPDAAKAKTKPGKKAHQADGTDSSKSFQAGIADEGTIPE